MSYCLNPDCPRPENPEATNFCQHCGAQLLLGNRYRALGLIGQGGFGRTFLAVDESKRHAPRCVIKQFFPSTREPGSFEQAAALFRQEAERLDNLGQHPQIPQLLAHFETAEGQYLVQEFIDGRNLTQQLKAEGPFSEAQIRDLLNELLPVLQYMHRAQVIHRDIKPDNIIRPLYRPDQQATQGDPVVLVDFGAAKFATRTALASTGTVIGSAAYAAPEQAVGRAEFASDLYSLGVTCIHLLTGIHPFDLYSVSEDTWVWQQYLSAPISPELGRILNQMLQKATRSRYQTAEQVLEDLNLSSTWLALKRRNSSQASRSSADANLAIAPPLPPASTTDSWKCIHTLAGYNSVVTAIAVSPDGTTIATGSTDSAIRLWVIQTGELLHTFSKRSLWFGSGHTDPVSAVLFNPITLNLFSSSYDGTIKQWDWTKRKLTHTLAGDGWGVLAIALSPDGQTLAIGGERGDIKLWDLDTKTLVATLAKHKDRITSVAISPDGLILASSSYDKTIRLWDLATGQLLNTLRAHPERVSALAMGPTWQLFASGGWDATVRLWQLGSEKPYCILAKHRDRISAIAIHPAGHILATGSEDSTLRLWNLETGDLIQTLRHAWGLKAVAFSPDGQTLVSSSTDETLKIWRQELISAQ
ncbi:MAG: protein kinase [Cyanothece sp. SIO1E1]|nr:protein kinase [Cyanothece sp. SIO1E1]